MNIIFLGPPGSGKGSQAQKLSKSGDFVHFSTGDMLREEIEAKSKFGNQISDLIDKGLFVPDELMVSLLKERLLKVNENQNIIFDGFPRNLDQIPILENMLSEQNQKIDFVLYFNAPKEILEERIMGRFACKDCGEGYNEKFNMPIIKGECNICHSHEFSIRKDDTQEIFNKRFLIYQKVTQPLFEYFKEKGNLIVLDATKNLLLVKENIENIIAISNISKNILK